MAAMIMRRTRANFKLALRYCRQHCEQIKADKSAMLLSNINNDCKKFWHHIKMMRNTKVTKYANTVANTSGASNIAALWRNVFESLYNSVHDDVTKNRVYNRLSAIDVSDIPKVSLTDLNGVLNAHVKDKSAGPETPDGINMEAFIYSGLRMRTHLCLLFNMCIVHGYLPNPFMECVIIPLVKNKGGDFTDLSNMDNYRAIAISNSISKLLEGCILDLIKSSDVGKYQFGFKANTQPV